MSGSLNQRLVVGLRAAILAIPCVAANADGPMPSVWIHDQKRPLTDRAVLDDTLAISERFTERSTSARPYQIDPFQTQVDVAFDNEHTVGQAVGQLLAFIGYDFVIAGDGIDPHAETLFALPLPAVHRRFDGVSLDSAILALIGEGYLLVIDPIERAASVDVAPAARQHRWVQQHVSGPAQ